MWLLLVSVSDYGDTSILCLYIYIIKTVNLMRKILKEINKVMEMSISMKM